MNGFLRYYKWHLIFAVIIFVCLMFVLTSILIKTPADLKFSYVSENHMNVQYFNDSKLEIEMLLHDSNHDSTREASIKAFTSRDEAKMIEKLEELINSKESTIIISDKKLFEQLSDKSELVDVSQYMAMDDDLDYLEDENGRVYATSLENNSLAKRLGIIDNSGIYIAVLSKLDNGEKTSEMKNAMNIVGYIIENKNKYHM